MTIDLYANYLVACFRHIRSEKLWESYMAFVHVEPAADQRGNLEANSSGSPIKLRYGLEDRVGPIKSVIFGFQHVLVMFTAMVGSPLVIAQLLNLPPATRATMITACMFGCGIGTIVASLSIVGIGARLPLVMGVFAVYIGPIVAIAKTQSLGAATTALLIGGLMMFVISPLIGKIRGLFPPIVVGTLLVIVSMSLMKLAVNLATGFNTPFFGKPVTLLFTVGSIFLILIINRLTRGFLRSLSLFLALLCSYLVAIPLGLVSFAPVSQAAWFHIPTFAPYGPLEWPALGGLITILLYHLITAAETTSMTFAVCKIVGVEGTEARIRGSIAADGLCSAISSVFGGMPLTSYSQNAGAITLTGIGSRYVVATGGGILIVMALVPKIGAIIGIVPPFVLGGALIFMFGMIGVVGVRILAESMKTQRGSLLFAASLGLGAAATFANPAAFAILPASIRLLASDGIVVGMVTSVILNLVLPRDDEV